MLPVKTLKKDYYHTAFYITRIYYAFLLSMQTDTYGDIPVAYYVKGAMPANRDGISIMALLIITATGFRSWA